MTEVAGIGVQDLGEDFATLDKPGAGSIEKGVSIGNESSPRAHSSQLSPMRQISDTIEFRKARCNVVAAWCH
jgi:hypothetical protein